MIRIVEFLEQNYEIVIEDEIILGALMGALK
jgi:hypothetical protein